MPFITNSYGPFGPWCWFQALEINCSIHEAAIWEEIGLWIAAAGLVLLLTFGLSTASLFLLCYAIKYTKLQKLVKMGTTASILSLAAIVILIIMLVVPTKRSLQFGWFVTYDIALPVFFTLVPLLLLLAIHLPLSLMIVRLCQRS